MAEKIGEETRKKIMEVVGLALQEYGFDVLVTGSNAYAIPAVENENETAVIIVFSIPKGERGGNGYDPYEEAQAYTFKQNEKKVKAEKKAEKTKKETA
jgi:hypothetical protein